jgi:hypothetical protein
MTNDDKYRLDAIRKLIGDSIYSKNEEVIANLIFRLEKEYVELAELSTYGEYKRNWTHKQVLDFVTKET